jgi:hypothetical protein
MFVSATDYHPQITSPCINVGTLTGAPSFDLENNARPQPALSNPDMGCYEIDQLPTEVLSLQFEPTMDIYPNPSTAEVTVTFSKTTRCNIQLTNTLGEMLEQAQINSSSHTLDMSSRPKGIYFVTVSDEAGNKTVRKIVKM